MWSCGIFQVRQHCSPSEEEKCGRYKYRGTESESESERESESEKSDKVENVIQSYREIE